MHSLVSAGIAVSALPAVSRRLRSEISVAAPAKSSIAGGTGHHR